MLLTRDIITNNMQSDGIVPTVDNKMSYVLAKVQKNLAVSNITAYTPNMKNRIDGLEKKGRIISYTFSLCDMYNSMGIFLNKTKINENDSDEFKEIKNTEKAILSDCMMWIKELAPYIAKKEYNSANLEFSDGDDNKQSSRVKFALGNAINNINDDANSQKALDIIQNKAELIVEQIKNMSNGVVNPLMKRVLNNATNIAKKLNGQEVRSELKTNDEIIDDIRHSVELLIKDDSDSTNKVDRARAEQDLAKKISPLAMNLVRIPLEEKSAEKIEINQAKTNVLRSVWDGFIERPQSTNMLSDSLNKVLHKGFEPIDAREYNLDNSKIWNICAKFKQFRDLKFKLVKGLAREGFPPQELNNLSFADIAYILNQESMPTSRTVKSFQNKKVKHVDAIKISGKREAFTKKYVNKYEKEIRTLFEANHLTAQEIDENITQMKKGKSIKGFTFHHTYTLSNPEYYEKTTGKSFEAMVADVIFVSDEAHKLIHLIENNINRGGISKDDATSSYRTVFHNADDGTEYYYDIKPKKGVVGITDLDYSVIFDKSYIENLPDMNSSTNDEKQAKTPEQNNKPINNEEKIKEVRQKINHEKDNNIVAEKEKSISLEVLPQNSEKKEKVIRPDYRGLGKKGGNLTLFNKIRKRA